MHLRVRRRPGRPAGVGHREDVRAALLKAARALFARRDYKATSVREIAAAARVNPAMIHYHFGNKNGLYRAMLEETIGPVLHRIQALTARPKDQTDASIHDLLQSVMLTMAREPWVARLIVREVLAEGGPLRNVFVRGFAAKGGGRLSALLKREIDHGRIRRDLDTTLGALSFMSLALFPFIALPVAERVFGIKMTQPYVKRMIEHTVRLYYEGAAGKRYRRTVSRGG